MCIAINAPKGTSPTKGALETSFIYNSDGCGYCFAKDGKLIIKKGFFDFESFLKSYQKDNIQGVNKLIHFRISTSGKINKLNCHPFLITDELAMIHNGVIPHFGNKIENDTLQFVKLILRPIIVANGVKSLLNPSIQKMLIESIGNSKLAFLDNEGNSYIINEKLGHRYNSIWYSNETYKEKNSFSYYGEEFIYDESKCAECFTVLKNGEYDVCDYCIEDSESGVDGWGKKFKSYYKGIA